MADSDRVDRFLRRAARKAGEQFEEARAVYRRSKHASRLPTDETGRVRIVCRRHAERRSIPLDEQSRPACYEAGHPDCEGCVEDIQADCIETWEPTTGDGG